MPANVRYIGEVLELYNVVTSDTGRYICEIQTPAGASSDYIDLQIEGTFLVVF